METFQDVLSNLGHGSPLNLEPEERVTPEEDPEEGNPVGEPESEGEGKTEEEEQPTEPTPPKGKPEKEPKESEGEEEPEADPAEEEPTEEPEEKPDTVIIDGVEVTLEQLKEWRDQGLMLDDYTRKTMEVSNQRKELLQEKKDFQTLAQDIADDPHLKQFVAAHPEALGHLLSRPKAARGLIGNAKGVEEFWKEYEVIVDNPNIAQKLLDAPDEAEEELREVTERDSCAKVIGTLDQFIEFIGNEAYPEVDSNAVKEYVISLSGVPDEPTHDDVVAGTTRLYGLFFRQNEDGSPYIDHSLIEREYMRLASANVPAPKDEPEVDVEEHNKNIDAQLQTGEKPPKTPDGAPPAARGERPEIPDDFQGILQAFQSGG